jgi:hypothetical protein
MSVKSELEERARKYAKFNNIEVDLTKPLGFGQDGSVWKSNRGSGATAVKVFEREANYVAERECYQRLAENGIDEICGLAVPSLEGSDDLLLIVEMTIVEPPRILDFGKAHLDIPFEFSDEGYEEWIERIVDDFGNDDLPLIKRILARLEGLGIYYYDVKPGNLLLRRNDTVGGD